MIVLGVLVAFAVVLINQQNGDRQDIKDNFHDRAITSAALTQALFEASATAGAAENTRKYGTRDVSSETMAQAAQQGQSTYMVLLGPDGKVISAAPGTPKAVLARLETNPPDVRAVAAGGSYGLSNFLSFPKIGGGFEYASPVDTEFGRRVIVTGISPQLLATFLGGYLRKVPSVSNGAAYLLDGNGITIAATTTGAPPGSPPQTPGLVNAVRNGTEGGFGNDQYFVSASLQGSPWKVVATAPQGNLFSSVSGAHKWVPWVIFGLFAAAAAFALVLLIRVLRNADLLADANQRLGDANDRLADANEALEQRARELSRSNSELEQFASIASHDLKEPLRKVQTFTEQLTRTESDRLSPEGRDYLERTTAAGARMQALIDDLLTLSRVATRARASERVDLHEVAEHAVSDLEAVIEESGGSVAIGEMPTVMADPLQMRQLIQNLISNGLKFHREGVPPRVRVSGRADGRLAEFTVTDNGIGFESRHKGRIFKVFERLHGRGVYGGTGIGLALCRKIVDRHGGSITAESVPGEGSAFTVALPVNQAAEQFDGAATNGNSGRVESEAVHA
jgi:signal transduction histidine kinase